jgi:hypothetical protein
LIEYFPESRNHERQGRNQEQRQNEIGESPDVEFNPTPVGFQQLGASAFPARDSVVSISAFLAIPNILGHG